MDELAVQLVALMRSHHYGTTYEKEMQLVEAPVHGSWATIATHLYQAYCRSIRQPPREDGQVWRPRLASSLETKDEDHKDQ